MTKTLQLTAEIPPNREILIQVPLDFPTGLARVVLESAPETGGHTLGELARSEFFGLWKDRSDIEDSASFARDLRRRAWDRQS